MQEGPAKVFLQAVGLIGRGWPFGPPEVSRKTPPTQAAEPKESPVPADLEPPKGSALGLGLGLGSG